MSFLKSFRVAEPEQPKVSRILSDFPWLWAIRYRWTKSSTGDVRVSQNLEELRLVLTAPSEKTVYGVWHYGIGCYGSEIVASVRRLPDASWCRAIMAATESGHGINIIATHYGEGYGNDPIVLYRHPEKKPLNDFIQQTDEIHGIRRGWRLIWPD